LAALRQAATADIPVIMVTILDEQRRRRARRGGPSHQAIERERLRRLIDRFSRACAADAVLLVEDEASRRARARLARGRRVARPGGGERTGGTGVLASGKPESSCST